MCLCVTQLTSSPSGSPTSFVGHARPPVAPRTWSELPSVTPKLTLSLEWGLVTPVALASPCYSPPSVVPAFVFWQHHFSLNRLDSDRFSPLTVGLLARTITVADI